MSQHIVIVEIDPATIDEWSDSFTVAKTAAGDWVNIKIGNPAPYMLTGKAFLIHTYSPHKGKWSIYSGGNGDILPPATKSESPYFKTQHAAVQYATQNAEGIYNLIYRGIKK